MKISGIYTITNKINGKMYIGFTIDFELRVYKHKSDLKYNKHKNILLQRVWNKHGSDNLVFEILEECPEEFLCTLEHYWCNMLNTHSRKYGYNVRPTHPDGIPTHSLKTREKISNSLKGKIKSKESIEKGKITRLTSEKFKNRKLGISMKGKKHSEESKEKMSKAIDRKKISERMRGNTITKGKKLSKEHIQKIVTTRKINGYRHSEETKEKIRNGNKKGRKYVPKLLRKDYILKLSIVTLQFDLNGNLIKEWKSAIEAARTLKISQTIISKRCRENNIKPYKNYIWKSKK